MTKYFIPAGTKIRRYCTNNFIDEDFVTTVDAQFDSKDTGPSGSGGTVFNLPPEAYPWTWICCELWKNIND